MHTSQGPLEPASKHLRSEVDIVCSLALATLGDRHGIPWAEFRDDYSEIRQRIARVVPGCAAYDEKVDQPGGFVLPHPPRDTRTFPTEVGKAIFTVSPTEVLHVPEGRLLLQTMRSHDQFNTTIYGLDDRYRGIKGGRRVVLVQPARHRVARLRGRAARRHRQRVGGRLGAQGRAVPHRLLRHSARLRRRLLPRDELAGGPRLQGGGQQPAGVQVDRREAGAERAGRAGGGPSRERVVGVGARREGPAAVRRAATELSWSHNGAVSNLEDKPDEVVCRPARGGIEVMTPRDVPLGGPRAMTVRRTLPQRDRSLIGAWCFLDHYGPDDVADTGGMSVAPHPHTGLQTVSWLFTGEVEHRDSAGHHAMVRPGELNLMTAGHGISHSEVSPRRDDRAARRPALGRAARGRARRGAAASTTTRRRR